MRNLFPRLRRTVKSAEPGIVDGPAGPEDADPAPPRPEAAGRFIDVRREEQATERAAQLAANAHRPLFAYMRMAACRYDQHLFDAIVADRDSVEAVNDRLRATLEVQNEQLRKARLMLAARTGTSVDGLLVPWEQHTTPAAP